MKWDVFIDGISLNNEAVGVTDITGLGVQGGRDFYNTSSYGLDGESSIIGGFTPKTFGMTILVDGRDRETGSLPEDSTPEAEAWANLQWLQGVLTSDYLLNVVVAHPWRTGEVGASKALTCDAELYAISEPRWSANRDFCHVTLGLRNSAVYFTPLGGGGLDEFGYKTINVAAGATALTLPTDVHEMNGFIEDAVITIQNGANAVKKVSIKSLNRSSGSLPPELIVSSTRTNGVLSASASMEIDCKAHTILHTSGATTESMVKYADWKGGRPGSMLRIGQPYQLQLEFTPYTPGASMAGITWSIKYRPSFI